MTALHSPRQTLKAPLALKIFVNCIILTFLYTNVAVVLSYTKLPVRLPTNYFADTIFNIYSVFSSYMPMNRAFVISILAEDQFSGKPTGWVQLDTDELFPFNKGAQSWRIWASLHAFKLGEHGQRQAQQFLAQRIVDRYNRMHPGQQAVGIEIGMETWPTSRRSYDDLRIPRLTKYYIIYRDAADHVLYNETN